ncbi:NAD-dependent epimerase/dehydratase family protein [Halalkalibacter sp. AB-rgal2]|uniref:NAD-dependent epimerase/dehydratase family protein n=1 Tax=Halalkalibacter sp. AB-rgal2 TaxID=3242695 RepID=UPI00359D3E29
MKKVLITGSTSYVGKSFQEWIEKGDYDYSIDTISVRDDSWKETDFSRYDTVLHLAGIAHVSSDPKQEELYYRVNRDLTIEVANKAKNDGVKQFIFMSSIIVYGDSSREARVIDEHTIPTPSNFYGNSKLQAEQGIKPLSSEDFKVGIIRPPMIYGKGSKGNYPKLAKAARLLPIFPNIDNQRSMLHVDNLSEFIRLMIENEEEGLFFPQNEEYVKTSEMVRLIGDVHGKKVRLVSIFNFILKPFINRVGILNKVFGNLVYSEELSLYDKGDYQINHLRKSIEETEVNGASEMNIDVLIMSDNSLETVGGEQESTKIIINGVKDSFHISVIQPGQISKPVYGVDYHIITKKTRIKHLIKNPIAFLLYIAKVRNYINKKRPAVIHTQAQVSFFIVALLKKLKLIPKRIRIVHTERGLFTKYNNFFKRIFYSFIKELDVLVTTTTFNMKHWKEAIQNKGIQVEFKVIENTAGELFEIYDPKLVKESNDTIVIGFAGRYCDWKNWPLAVEISKGLNGKLGEKLQVKMAVGCLDEASRLDTEKMFGAMKEMIGERFEGKINIDLKEMDKFYYDIDFFVLTSNYNTESFGRTLVEAMSRGTVVLTTDSGGSVEVVGDDDYVCKGVNDFVERIYTIFLDQNLMKDQKISNLKYVNEKYSLNNNVNKHNTLYSNLAE